MFGIGFLIFGTYVVFLVWNIVYNGNKQQEENYPDLIVNDHDTIDMDGIGNQGRVPFNNPRIKKNKRYSFKTLESYKPKENE